MNASATVPEIETSGNQAAANRIYREIINQTDLALAFQNIDRAAAELNDAFLWMAWRERSELSSACDRVKLLDLVDAITKVRAELEESCAGRIALQKDVKEANRPRLATA